MRVPVCVVCAPVYLLVRYGHVCICVQYLSVFVCGTCVHVCTCCVQYCAHIYLCVSVRTRVLTERHGPVRVHVCEPMYRVWARVLIVCGCGAGEGEWDLAFRPAPHPSGLFPPTPRQAPSPLWAALASSATWNCLFVFVLIQNNFIHGLETFRPQKAKKDLKTEKWVGGCSATLSEPAATQAGPWRPPGPTPAVGPESSEEALSLHPCLELGGGLRAGTGTGLLLRGAPVPQAEAALLCTRVHSSPGLTPCSPCGPSRGHVCLLPPPHLRCGAP